MRALLGFGSALSLLACSSEAPEHSFNEPNLGQVTHELTLAQPVRIRLVSFNPGPVSATPREFAIRIGDGAAVPLQLSHSATFFECAGGGDCQTGGPVHSFLPGGYDPGDPRFFSESYEYIFALDAADATNTFHVGLQATEPQQPGGELLDFTLTLDAAGTVTGTNTSDGDIAALDNSCVQANSGWTLCWQTDLVNAAATPRAEVRLASILLEPSAPSSQSTFVWGVYEGPPGRFPGGSQPALARRRATGPFLRCSPGGDCDLSALGVEGTALVSLEPTAIPDGDGRFFPVSNKHILPFDPAEAPVEFVFVMGEDGPGLESRSRAYFTFSLDVTGNPIDFQVMDDDVFPNVPTDWEVTEDLPVAVTGDYGEYCLSSATRGITLCFDIGAEGVVPFEPAPGGARWLRAQQFKRSVENLLGPEAGAAAQPPPDPVIPVASVEAFQASVDLVAATQYEANAISIAETALEFPARLAEHAPCVTQGPTDAAFRQFCYEEVAHRLGFLAFRLPPLDDVKARLVEIGTLGESEGTTDTERMQAGLTYLIATILQAPSFLYSVEVGEAATGDGARSLNAFELASRLSLFLQGRLPSEDLLDRAGAGELDSVSGVRAVASDLLDEAAARGGFLDQVDELFQVKLLQTKGKDAAIYPDFSPALADSMREEVQRFVLDIVFDAPRSFISVLTDERRFVNADLAQLVYGIAPPATEWELVDFSTVSPDQKRAGIMTMPAMMTLLSHPVHNSIVRRGLFANDRLFCQTEFELPRVDTSIKIDNDGTLRDFMEQVEASPGCTGCHVFMNRLGYAFESFDAMGRFRTEELDANGAEHPIDASSSMVLLTDGNTFGDYADARDWAQNAANLDHLVSRCWVDQIYRNGVGAEAGPEQDAVLANIDANFASGGHLMRELLLEFVSSPAFMQVGAPR